MTNLHERMLPTRQGSNPQHPDLQSDEHLTEPPRSALQYVTKDREKEKKLQKVQNMAGRFYDFELYIQSRAWQYGISSPIAEMGISEDWESK